jgi:hypothetical protein
MNILNHNTQYNKMHYIISRYFVLQYHVEHCYMFRSLMGSSSGNYIKVTLHKIELTIHVKRCQKVKQLNCERLLYRVFHKYLRDFGGL